LKKKSQKKTNNFLGLAVFVDFQKTLDAFDWNYLEKRWNIFRMTTFLVIERLPFIPERKRFIVRFCVKH